MIFTIDTEEKVMGVYLVEAETEEEARELFEQGSVQPAVVFESVETKVIKVTVS